MTYPSLQSFPGAVGAVFHTYRANRGDAGWTSTDLSPEAADPRTEIFFNTNAMTDLTGDLRTGIFSSRPSFSPLDQDGFGENVYVREPTGVIELVSRGNGEAPDFLPDVAEYVGRSRDARHLLFQSQAVLDAEGGSNLAEKVFGREVYDRTGGSTKLVSVDTDETLTSPCGAVLGGAGFRSPVGSGAYRSAVSSGGDRIVFSSPDPEGAAFEADPSCAEPTQIYVRDGSVTHHVSASQRALADPSDVQPAIFQGASKDGSEIFFTSGEALTEGAIPVPGAGSPFLYRYDVNTESLHLLTPNDAGNPDVLGVVALSDDGSKVYYLNSRDELRLSSPDGDELVASGDGLSAGAPDLVSGDESRRQVRISPDGDHLVFATTAHIGSFDNTAAPGAVCAPGQGGGRCYELYRYASEDDQLLCVSCNSFGQLPEGDALLRLDVNGGYEATRNLLLDGSVVFQTGDDLVPVDTNKSVDVYLWRPSGVDLISSGRGKEGAYFADASSTGRDIFMATAESLVREDSDEGGIDVYDARQGGGFLEAPDPVPGCTGEACQSTSPPIPAPPAIGSSAVDGPQSVRHGGKVGKCRPKTRKRTGRADSSKARSCKRKHSKSKNKKRPGARKANGER